MRKHYEADRETFSAPAYAINGWRGVAWHVLGWETVPDEDTEWSGCEVRTGKVVCCMVGDDRYFAYSPDELTPIKRSEYCGGCGQIGCGCDAYSEEEEES
jgi:hypothetical protein